MKNLKYLIVTALFLLVSTVSFSQEKDMEAKATAKVEELNDLIKKGNPEVALTDDQKAEIFDIQMDRLKEVSKTRKEVKDKEAQKPLLKEINKKHFKKIFSEVLTKEQRAAHKLGKGKGAAQ